MRAAKQNGKLAALFGVEGGHMLGPGTEDEQLQRARRLARLGARYLTLTHTTTNDLGGSSGDEGRTKGITPFGLRMLAELEKLGVIADVSHVSTRCSGTWCAQQRSPCWFALVVAAARQRAPQRH